MTTFEQWRSPGSRLEIARPGREAKKYDIRVVDQFYVYCDAVARTHRHRDEAQLQSQLATRRNIASLLIASGLVCYYLLERISQVISLL
jgi:hypothetical protein